MSASRMGRDEDTIRNARQAQHFVETKGCALCVVLQKVNIDRYVDQYRKGYFTEKNKSKVSMNEISWPCIKWNCSITIASIKVLINEMLWPPIRQNYIKKLLLRLQQKHKKMVSRQFLWKFIRQKVMCKHLLRLEPWRFSCLSTTVRYG